MKRASLGVARDTSNLWLKAANVRARTRRSTTTVLAGRDFREAEGSTGQASRKADLIRYGNSYCIDIFLVSIFSLVGFGG